MKKRGLLWSVVGFFMWTALSTHAWAVDLAWEEFNQFIQNTKTLQANFIQTVDGISENRFLNAPSKKTLPKRPQKGRLLIKKPNYLRWEIFEPSEQLIIVDTQASTAWVYDPDLQQAIYQPLNQQQTITPAEILLGREGLEKNFLLNTVVDNQNHTDRPIVWLNATPKSAHNAFQWIRLKMNKGQLAAIRILDVMDRHITITFLASQYNIPIAPEQFQFTPPVGVDVINQVDQAPF